MAEWNISARVLNLGARQRRIVPRQLSFQGQSLQYPLRTRMCGSRNQSGREECKNSLRLSGIKHRHHDHPAHSLVTTLNELSKFLNQRNRRVSITPHVSHNIVLSESHPLCYGYMLL
jgi:hypothetical protein